MSGIKDNAVYLLIGLILIAGVSFTLVDLLIRPIKLDSPPNPSTPKSSDSESLVVSGWAERDTASNERFRIWIFLDNLSGHPIAEVTLISLETPGFEKVGKCWLAGIPSCIEPTKQPRTSLHLEVKDTQTIWADIKPKSWAAGSFWLRGNIRWMPAGQASRVTPFLIGPIEIPSRFLAAGRALYTVLKDLMMPFVLLLLGWLFKERLSTISHGFQLRMENLATSRKKEESRTAQIHQTWNQMLQESHKYANKYYLPAWRSADYFVLALNSSNDSRAKECTLHLLQLFKIMGKLRSEAGGIFFKKRLGEKILGASWRQIYDHVQRILDPRILGLGRDSIGEIMDLPQYEQFMNVAGEGVESQQNALKAAEGQRKALEDAQEKLEEWLERESHEPLKSLLRIFSAVLDIESNRPYRWWYDRRQDALDAEQEAMDELESAISALAPTLGNGDDDEKGLILKCREYVSEIRQKKLAQKEKAEEKTKDSEARA